MLVEYHELPAANPVLLLSDYLLTPVFLAKLIT